MTSYFQTNIVVYVFMYSQLCYKKIFEVSIANLFLPIEFSIITNVLIYVKHEGFPGGSDGKESVCSTRDPGLIPGLGRYPGEGNSNPLQYSCLENSMDREAWWATVHGQRVGHN